jgi:endonuclease/exonuclease/phosphatase family metal-dependent hydrolase
MASAELGGLAERHDLDLLCLQECDTKLLPAVLGDLKLADATKLNRLGLAIYYRESRFTPLETKTFMLKKSLHDMIASPTHERLIGTRFFDDETGHEFIAASFHAAPLTATNSLRRNQIKAAHAALKEMGEDLPTVMVGDYNYPLFQKGLGKHIGKTGYDLSLSDRRTYTRYKIFTGHFDFVTSVGMTIESVETLPIGASDHLPILVNAASIAKAAAA